ncbi:Uncharacterised protein [Candidatus Bilamarchaeum dharawalense]|uniref:Dienelactone hydrolase domain-containing protein n=1 Tax=Candidatus Bilamarchaeum dharawalense TaxID=2885759 RepID=A0A5E4LQZ8_9ARCH|nr:Uncharacterised protein [Candidatus Bilamarchaeum dharawalense]
MAFVNKKVIIPIDSKKFEGSLTIPPRAKSIIIFAHGGGGGRYAPRNNSVARVLNKNNMGTLLFDMLTKKEDNSNKNNLDIRLLSRRLIAATLWLKKQPEVKKLRMGYFAVSSGTAAAIIAASKLKKDIFAIVSKSGRPDLSMSYLDMIKAPMLFIVGEEDEIICELNEQAYVNMAGEKLMIVVPNAGHFFDEPGTQREATKHSLKWFKKHLRK